MAEDFNQQAGAEETTEAFLEGWDDVQTATEEQADQPATEGTEHTEGGTEAQPIGDGAATESNGEAETTAETGAPAEQKWPMTIKYFGKEETIKEEDITKEFVQKGRAYDDLREKYDKSKPVMELFTRLAEKNSMSVEDYTTFLRTEVMKAGGMSEEEAKRTIALEDREAVIAAKETAQKEAETAAAAQNAADQRVKNDLADFEKAFPDVYKLAKGNPAIIPQSVWDDCNKGMSLTVAYSKYAVAKAQADAKTAVENAQVNSKNAERATGSLKSAGADTKNSDPFLEGWG